jgi:O-Antigen ligase
MSAGAPEGAPRPAEAAAGAASEPSHRSATAGLAEVLLVLLALVLPFEAPLFRLGPLQLTTVELALYAMLSAWGVGVALEVLRDRAAWRPAIVHLGRDPMARAAVLWAAVLFASAAVAPSDRPAAFKFALRSLSGVLAFFAARSLARRRGVARDLMVALVVGGLASAMTAVIDMLVPGSAPAWRLFHAGTFDELGLVRASGVFEYPTIGAMYWEAVVPVLIVAPLAWTRADTAVRRARLAVAASAVLFLAIFASATRSAIVGAAVACGLMAVLGRRSGPPVPRVAVASLGVLVAVTLVALRPGGSDARLGQRLRWWHDDRWLGVRYEVPGAQPTLLSYHWTVEPEGGAPARLVEFDGLRTDLPEDVPPGGIAHVAGIARAPTAGGAYLLSWDLVQEDITWFSARGNAPGEQAVDVRTESAMPPPPTVLSKAEPLPAPRRRLWRAAVSLWQERPLLGVGPDNFRRRYEALLSPSPTGVPYTDTRIHANSLYFETLADLGLAGIAALTAIAFALVRCLRQLWETRCVAGLACAVAAFTFFVHGLLDYFFEFTPLFGLFWVTLGLTAAFAQGPRALPAPRGMPR